MNETKPRRFSQLPASRIDPSVSRGLRQGRNVSGQQHSEAVGVVVRLVSWMFQKSHDLEAQATNNVGVLLAEPAFAELSETAEIDKLFYDVLLLCVPKKRKL